MQKLGTVPNEHICKEIASSLEDAQIMDLNVFGRTELLTFTTNLDFYANTLAV